MLAVGDRCVWTNRHNRNMRIPGTVSDVLKLKYSEYRYRVRFRDSSTEEEVCLAWEDEVTPMWYEAEAWL